MKKIFVFIFAVLWACLTWAADEQNNGKQSFTHLKNERANIIADIDGIKGGIKKNEIGASQIISSVADIENFIRSAKLDIERIEKRLKNEGGKNSILEGDLQYRKDGLARAESDLTKKTKFEKELSESSLQLKDKERRLSEIETQINELLSRDIVAQDFKSRISLYFAMVIAIMVVCFFGISFYDPKVRLTIFSGQAGMQFVTLFSLIIAIILFGITGVLGDKELAALLGGLSGYILGRYNHTEGPSADKANNSNNNLPQVPGAEPH